MGTRIVNMALGCWLFMSVLLWPHSRPQFVNALWVGFLVLLVAAIAAGAVARVRFVNSALGLWLMASTFVLPSEHRGTVWNHLCTGFLVFLVSLLPNLPERQGGDVDRVASGG
jgi:hypothetical protein